MLLQVALFQVFWLSSIPLCVCVYMCVCVCVCVCVYHIFIHSLVNGYLDWYWVLSIINSTAMNIEVHVYF